MPKSKKKSSPLLARIGTNRIAMAFASLGNRFRNLKDESWRLNRRSERPTSLWSDVSQELGLDGTEEVCHSLYNFFYRHKEELEGLIRNALNEQGVHVSASNDNNGHGCNNLQLNPETSIPLPQRPSPKTRTNKKKCAENNSTAEVYEASFILTAEQWRQAYSYKDNKMKDEWPKTFLEKLKNELNITCALRVLDKHIKKGERKQANDFFWFKACCTNSNCKRNIKVMLKENVEIGSSPMFRVEISGEVNHDRQKEKMFRHLTGEERRRVGKDVLYCLYYRIT